MKSKSVLSATIHVLLPTLLLMGCGGGDNFKRVPLRGTVTVDGDAGRSGSLVATANLNSLSGGAENGTTRPTCRTSITDGKFEFPADTSPTAGDYSFEVSLTVAGGEAPKASGESRPGDAMETGAITVNYRKAITVPDGGSESLAVELTAADLASADGGMMPASGER